MDEVIRVKAGYRELSDRVSLHADQYHIHRLKKELMLAQFRQKMNELQQKYGAPDQMPENVRKAFRLLIGNATTLEAEIQNTDQLIQALHDRIAYQSSLLSDQAILAAIGAEMREAYKDLPLLSR